MYDEHMKQYYGYLVIDCKPQYPSEIKVYADGFSWAINLVTFPIISIPLPFLLSLPISLACFPQRRKRMGKRRRRGQKDEEAAPFHIVPQSTLNSLTPNILKFMP